MVCCAGRGCRQYNGSKRVRGKKYFDEEKCKVEVDPTFRSVKIIDMNKATFSFIDKIQQEGGPSYLTCEEEF